MKKVRIIFLALVMLITTTFSGCDLVDAGLVKLNMRNADFDYIKNGDVNKIIIQNARDLGFRFVVTDPKAIQDIYEILKTGKVKEEKTSLSPDYTFLIYDGNEVKEYSYVVNVDEKGVGNFYNKDTYYSISKSLDDVILDNLSFISKPRNFEDIYYGSILSVLKKVKGDISDSNKVGVDITGDVNCLKYMFSVDLKDFEKELDKVVPGTKLINNDAVNYDTVITVKNRGFNSKTFKTTIVVDNKKDKSYETYYVQGKYEYKNWDITVSDANNKPDNW